MNASWIRSAGRGVLVLVASSHVALAHGQSTPAPAPSPPDNPAPDNLNLDRLKPPTPPVFSLAIPAEVWKGLGVSPVLTPGDWVEYRESNTGFGTRTMRISVIRPTRKLPSRKHRIVEFRVESPTGRREYVKVLLNGGFDRPSNIERMMIAHGDGPPLDLPISPGADAGISDVTHEVTKTELKYVFENKGIEKISVPAGTYKARHVIMTVRGPDGAVVQKTHFWVAPDLVGVMGFVKVDGTEGKFELLALGKNAKSDLPDFRKQ